MVGKTKPPCPDASNIQSQNIAHSYRSYCCCCCSFGFPIGTNGLYFFFSFIFDRAVIYYQWDFGGLYVIKWRKHFITYFFLFFSLALSIHFYQYAITSSMRQPITLFRQYFFFVSRINILSLHCSGLNNFVTPLLKNQNIPLNHRKKNKNNQHIDSIWHSTQNIFQNEHTDFVLNWLLDVFLISHIGENFCIFCSF